MESKPRVYRERGAGSAGHGEQHSRALMQLILHDVILSKADAASRRVVIAYSAAAMSALLSQPRRKSEICLSDLKRLRAEQLDRLLAAARYVFAIQCDRTSRTNTRNSNERRRVSSRMRLASKPRTRSSETSWH